MEINSDVFDEGGRIPPRYGADSENDLPPLTIHGVPPESQSLVVIFEDIDAAIGPITHWLVWNLPPETAFLDAVHIPQTARTGLNGYGKVGYTGPAPPAGAHHYRFRLLALDTVLDLQAGERLDRVESAISDHVLAEAALNGYFSHEKLESTS